MRRDTFCLAAVFVCTAPLSAGIPAGVLANPGQTGDALTSINRYMNTGPAAASDEPAALGMTATPSQVVCPLDTLYAIGKPAYGQDEPWAVYVSNARFPGFDPENQVLVYAYFAGAGAPIERLRWWGVGATFDDQGVIAGCPLTPGEFEVSFWAHDAEWDRPDYAAGPLFSFTASAASGLETSDTGQVYQVLGPGGEVAVEFPLWAWDCELPAAVSIPQGWISIQNTDLCAFWWAASGLGVDVHVQQQQLGTQVLRYDFSGGLSYCLRGDQTGEITGACCDYSSGICRNTSADECVGFDDEFFPGRSCTQIACTAVMDEWACCLYSGECQRVREDNCYAGTWHRYYVCSTSDPDYDPAAFGGVGNLVVCTSEEFPCPITCETPAVFSRGLSGGYLDLGRISWDRGPADAHYVIDNYTGTTGQLNRLRWWGNATHFLEGVACLPPDPAAFVIKFYEDTSTPGGPVWEAPAMVYDGVIAHVDDTAYGWTGHPELGNIYCYTVQLDPTYAPGAGLKWISIASQDPECDFLWAPGSDGGVGQWLYDSAIGTALPQPGQRHSSLCLHTNTCTGACCDEATGGCQDGQEEFACGAAGGMFYKNTSCSQIPEPGCYPHPGACCDHNDGSCAITLSTECEGAGLVWLGPDSTCAECCVALCPPEGTPEGEPACGPGYVDDFNMGCFTQPTWSYPDDWVTITDDQTICGRTGTVLTGSSGFRDLDFYTYTLDDPVALVQAHVRGEFTPDVWLLVGQCFADPAGGTYVLAYSQGYAGPCGDAVASAALSNAGPTAGVFYIVVSCYGMPACETPYTLSVEKLPAGCCRMSGYEDTVRSENVCLALGGEWTPGACRACGALGDSNCDGAVNAFDIDPFVTALTAPAEWAAGQVCDYLCANDLNCDGAVNTFDIDPFVLCLTAGGCGQCE